MGLLNLLIQDPLTFVLLAIPLLYSIIIHELAHGWVAYRMGDPTAKQAGRLSLNPLKHLDPVGTLMLFIFGFGWAKPVPVNPWRLKQHSPSAMMWVSLAGPASNLLMAILAGLILRTGLLPVQSTFSFLPSPADFLLTFAFINLILVLFNIIPIAPLDGAKVLEFLLPGSLKEGYSRLQPYGPIILLVLLFVLPRFGIDIIGWFMTPALIGFQKLLLGG